MAACDCCEREKNTSIMVKVGTSVCLDCRDDLRDGTRCKMCGEVIGLEVPGHDGSGLYGPPGHPTNCLICESDNPRYEGDR